MYKVQTYPNFLRQGVEEAEHTGFLLDGLLYHDGYAEGHEGLAEVDHALTL